MTLTAGGVGMAFGVCVCLSTALWPHACDCPKIVCVLHVIPVFLHRDDPEHIFIENLLGSSEMCSFGAAIGKKNKNG